MSNARVSYSFSIKKKQNNGMNKFYSFREALSFFLIGAIALISVNLTAQTNFGAFQDNNFFNVNNWTNGLPAVGKDGTIPNGYTANINSSLTVNYVLTSYGTINANATVTINGTLNNYTGSDFNIGSAGSLVNNGTMDQRGSLDIAANGKFTNGNTANYSSTGTGIINNSGTVSIGGTFSNLGTINNSATLNFTAGNFANNTAINNSATLNFNGGTLTNVNGANINNLAGATFNHKTGAVINNQGTLTNAGNYQNNGAISSNGTVVNNGLFNNNIGGDITNNFRLNNTGTFNNNNQGNILNEFEINNSGVFTNNFFVDNGAAINNLAGGSFINAANGDINNQFGSSINNANIFSNLGEIVSVGEINNTATFTNGGSIQTNTGGGITNAGNFTNNNLLSNLEKITNTGIFNNNGQLQNSSGGVFTNNGDLYNNATARIANQFDLVNNKNLYNFGTVENGVRIFNNKFFQNNGYLINIGDFDNNPTGIFENTATGVLENDKGGVFTNYGTLNNNNEIFNFACSSFVNKGIINNYYWFTNKGIFFQLGTFNKLPHNWMNMNGGVVVTGATSSEICQSETISLDADGKAAVFGTSIVAAAFDTCSTIDLKINNQESVNFTCADIGTKTVTLKLTDRKGNSVTCSTTVTIVDDRAPEFQNCPADVVVISNSTTAPASWTPPTATDNCGPVNVTSTHNPGASFPIGTTQVTYTAKDGKNNVSAPCEFNVVVVPQGDCAEVASIRKVTSTNDNCGSWCGGAYALAFGSGQCYTAGSDLLFIEYKNGTAQLVGSVFKGSNRGYVEIFFSGKTATPPSGSPKYELCVNSGASNWSYYPSFEGSITLENCRTYSIKRYGPSFQMGIGGNLQDKDKLGASGWFTFNGQAHGDFNFRLGDLVQCQNSIYLEAECANSIGSKWQIRNDANASGGKSLMPPSSYSYDYPPVGTQDVVSFNVNVAVAGYYRLFARTNIPNGSGDSYWVRVNNGNWVKWNSINASQYGSFQWDQAGQWEDCDNDVPVTFQLNAGSNNIQFSWREPNASLDKIYLTLTGKKPTGMGGDAKNCSNPNTPPSNPLDGKTLCIISRHSNKSADIANATKTDGGKLIQWDAHGGANQKFKFTAVGPNTYTITPVHSGKCLDAYANGNENGTRVVQWTCHGGSNQQWVVEDAGNGFYFIKNVSNGLYLDVKGNSTSNGGDIHLWEKHGGLNQQWSLEQCTNTPPPCNKTALFVVGSTSLNGSDAAVKSRLQSLGYTVTLKDDDACNTSDANGKGLILISSTCNSGSIGSKYRDVAVPVIVWEAWLMDDMKMTGSWSNSYGATDYVSKIRIQDSDHPIAQGATGEFTVFSKSKTVTWGLPGSGASRIGYIPGNPNCVMLYAYDAGASMVGMTAPARRVGFFLHNSSAEKLTNTGWQLFERTVQWASGCASGANLEADETVLSLKAVRKNRQVNLYWTNNTGFKNEYFTLEKSKDGANWEAMNEMDAYREEDQSTNLFEEVDFAPTTGKNYYRVSVTFLDGTRQTSDIQIVELNDIEDFGLYPNPASSFTNVNLETMVGEKNVTIRVTDWMGRTVEEIQIDEVIEPDYRLELKEYRTGQYAVSVIAEGKRPVTKKLIIF
jgi:hypothetical protein